MVGLSDVIVSGLLLLGVMAAGKSEHLKCSFASGWNNPALPQLVMTVGG